MRREGRNYAEGDGAYRIERPGRSPFGWLPRLGMNLLSFFADTGIGGGSAYASDTGPGVPCIGPITQVKCCFLACPSTEFEYEGNKSNYSCPDGFQKQYWFCCEGTTQIGCGECASGNDCGAGPWNCSIWWDTGRPDQCP